MRVMLVHVHYAIQHHARRYFALFREVCVFRLLCRIKMHQERDNKHENEAEVHEGAVPAYLLDREGVSHAKVLSNMIKQKRKEKAGKWNVPLPKVRPMADDEIFKVVRSGKRKGIIETSITSHYITLHHAASHHAACCITLHHITLHVASRCMWHHAACGITLHVASRCIIWHHARSLTLSQRKHGSG
jgi:hypothetical protein